MKDKKPCELISWTRFQKLAMVLANKIRATDYLPDIIIAIGRGGYMPARLLSDYFGIMDLTTVKIEHYRGSYKHPEAVVKYPLTADVNGKRILLVDDVSDSGDTFAIALTHIAEHGTPEHIRTAVLHHKTTSIFLPDFYAQKVVKWRWLIYPWAIIEDIASFIESELPPQTPVDEIVLHLSTNHGVRIPRQHIEDALLLLP